MLEQGKNVEQKGAVIVNCYELTTTTCTQTTIVLDELGMKERN